VHLTATYKFNNTDELIDVVQNRSGYLYSRWDNPSVVEVEKELAAMEGYDKALGFGSGMAAITTAIFAHLNAQSRIIATREIYGGTFELLNDILPKLNIETVFVNSWQTGQMLDEIERGVSILYLESPYRASGRGGPQQGCRGDAGCHLCVSHQPASCRSGG